MTDKHFVPGGEGLVKIKFLLPPEEHAEAEWLWAEPLGDSAFRLKNTPLFVEGIGCEDVVEAALDEEYRVLVFRQVIRRAGHSTYRVAVQPGISDERANAARDLLVSRGCVIEGLSPRMYAIDIPPSTDIDEIYEILEKVMADGTWLFDEMHVGHALRREP